MLSLRQLEEDVKAFQARQEARSKGIPCSDKDWLSYVSMFLGRAQGAKLCGQETVECTTDLLIAVLERHIQKEKQCG